MILSSTYPEYCITFRYSYIVCGFLWQKRADPLWCHSDRRMHAAYSEASCSSVKGSEGVGVGGSYGPRWPTWALWRKPVAAATAATDGARHVGRAGRGRADGDGRQRRAGTRLPLGAARRRSRCCSALRRRLATAAAAASAAIVAAPRPRPSKPTAVRSRPFTLSIHYSQYYSQSHVHPIQCTTTTRLLLQNA